MPKLHKRVSNYSMRLRNLHKGEGKIMLLVDRKARRIFMGSKIKNTDAVTIELQKMCT